MPALGWGFIFGMTWKPSNDQFGIFPIISGTLVVAMGAIVIATAIGVPCAIFLSEYSPFWLRNIIKPIVEIIVGIPSVVIGFWGLIVLVPMIRDVFPSSRGESILAGWIVLTFMVLPTLISLSEDSLRAVPRAYREASLALGATRWQTVRQVVIPNASSGIRAALILALGRAIGETMAVLMVIGSPEVPWLTVWPLDRVRMLAPSIVIDYKYVEWGSAHQHALFGMGVVLLILVMILNFISNFLIRRRRQL